MNKIQKRNFWKPVWRSDPPRFIEVETTPETPVRLTMGPTLSFCLPATPIQFDKMKKSHFIILSSLSITKVLRDDKIVNRRVCGTLLYHHRYAMALT